jgi:hypothetical protein
MLAWENGGVREDDGRQLDHSTLEALRLRAVDRVEQGADPREVARTFVERPDTSGGDALGGVTRPIHRS